MSLETKNNNKYIKKDLYGFQFDLHLGKEGAHLDKVLFTDEIKSKKAYKEYKKITSIIEFNGHKFQADPVSINFMSAVLNLANLRFNQAVAKGIEPAKAYELVYGQKIYWKDKRNNWVELRLDDIGSGLELALQKLKEILEKYS